MTLRYLVLFDIDGTLLWPDRAGRDSMRAALERVYGTAGPIDSFPFAGRTDSAIVRDLMAAAGIAEDIVQARFDELAATLEDEMHTRLADGRHNIRACPGALALVEALDARDDVLLGLLTGNLEPTARIKLAAAGYDPDMFRVGAFGGESPVRADLVPLAVERARALTGVDFRGKQIVVIGDTPEDVRCGEALGVQTVAVLTGWNTREELEAASPDVIFDDLTDTGAVIAAALASV
ncbi:MAG TPA: haloacid dehalogenase-like hydrolase [Aggregatilineales bacterium]|nr:haloacid dehalogenase-like hydrolase [Aggregatilineales bacterium]